MKPFLSLFDRILASCLLAATLAVVGIAFVNGIHIVNNASKLSDQIQQNFEHRENDWKEVKERLSRIEAATSQPSR